MNRLSYHVLLIALFAGPVGAQQTAPRPMPSPAPQPALAEAQRELETANRELDRTSRRIAELSQLIARDHIEAALERPAFERPVIGIVMSADDGTGIRLAAVTPRSPADEAGLRGGDRLLRINGQALSAPAAEARLAQARELIGNVEEGQSVRIAFARGNETREVTVAARSMPGLVWWRGDDATPEAIRLQLQQLKPLLAQKFDVPLGNLAPLAGCGMNGEDCLLTPMAEAFRWRGLRLAALEPKLGRYFGRDRGVLVLTTPGDELAGLEPGDVIVSLDGESVDQPQEAMRLMRDKAPGARIDVEFVRDRRARSVSLDAPKFARLSFLPPAPPAPPTPPAPPAVPSLSVPAAPPAPPAPPPPPDEERTGVLERVLGD